MKKINILIVILFCSVCCLAQTKTKKSTSPSRDSVLRALLKDSHYCDSPRIKGSAKSYYTDGQYISNYSMNRLIRQDITKITLGQDGLPVLGNYASLQYSSDNTNITLNTSLYNPFRRSSESDPIKSILSVNIKAGLSDNVAALFSNSDVNSGVSVKAKMSFLTRKTMYTPLSNVNCATIGLYRDRLYDNYVMAKNAYNLAKSLKIGDYNSRIKALKEKLTHEPSDSTEFQLLQLKTEYNTYMSQDTAYNENATIDSCYKSLLNMETKNAKWKQFRIEFWDVNVNLAGNQYNVFVPTLPVSQQLSTANFTTWSVGASFNHFASSNGHSFLKNGIFYKIGYTLSDDNNFDGAATKAITNTTTIDTTGFKREVVDNVNAYTGPLTKFFAHTFTGQFSKYLDEKKSTAISLYTTFILNFNKLDAPLTIAEKPNWTLGTGYTFAVLNKDKLTSVLNFELYLNFNDIVNSAGDDSKFYQRKEIGLKIGVPFNSIFLNKQ